MASIDQLRSSQAMTTNRNQNTVGAQTPSPSESVSGSKNNNDAVSLSTQGKAIGQLHHQLAAEPQFDSAKVAAIKEAIANGSYTVDPEKLAANMMKFEDELAGL